MYVYYSISWDWSLNSDEIEWEEKLAYLIGTEDLSVFVLGQAVFSGRDLHLMLLLLFYVIHKMLERNSVRGAGFFFFPYLFFVSFLFLIFAVVWLVTMLGFMLAQRFFDYCFFHLFSMRWSHCLVCTWVERQCDHLIENEKEIKFV